MKDLVARIVDEADRSLAARTAVAHGAARAAREAAAQDADALRDAAKQLGEVRGRAVRASVDQASTAEVARIHAGAQAALEERFLRRVIQALRDLRGTEVHVQALGAWAREAAAHPDPCEVYCAKGDRDVLYDALLTAGLPDFQIHIDRQATVGFVLRDLDGRTVGDWRPDALVARHADALRDLLAASVPPFRAPDASPPA